MEKILFKNQYHQKQPNQPQSNRIKKKKKVWHRGGESKEEKSVEIKFNIFLFFSSIHVKN